MSANEPFVTHVTMVRGFSPVLIRWCTVSLLTSVSEQFVTHVIRVRLFSRVSSIADCQLHRRKGALGVEFSLPRIS